MTDDDEAEPVIVVGRRTLAQLASGQAKIELPLDPAAPYPYVVLIPADDFPYQLIAAAILAEPLEEGLRPTRIEDRAARVRAILADSELAIAFRQIERELVMTWRAASDLRTREECHYRLLGLEQLKQQLARVLDELEITRERARRA